jgi:glucose-1-phosphate thymidylyltransferase
MKDVKGVILAGGLGLRLSPLTDVTNKHLLPIYKKPMIFYPIEKLVQAGLTEIMVVTGGPHAGHFLKVLGNGKKFGLKDIHYTYQEGEGGIGAALALAENFVDGARVVAVLGDNLFQDDLRPGLARFMAQKDGARIFLREVEDPERFGVASISGGNVVGIEEKPKVPKSNLAVTGVYMYDRTVFDILRTMKPSGRGEMEITDVNNAYIQRGSLMWEKLNGWWTDAGTFDSLYHANQIIFNEGAP